MCSEPTAAEILGVSAETVNNLHADFCALDREASRLRQICRSMLLSFGVSPFDVESLLRGTK